MRALGLFCLLLANCTGCPASGDFSEWFDPSVRGSSGPAPRPVGSPDGADIQALPRVERATARTVPAVAPTGGLKAFPGAEGFGAAATGGRGGRVIYVTTLNPMGPGSLGEALAQEGARTILFKVSGLISASLRIARGDVTIAGQTSPGGVIVRGLRTDESPFCDSDCGAGVRGVDNIIVRHLRTRPSFAGDNGNIDGDGLRLRHTRNAVIDHVSTENATDEAFEISYSNNITVQECILGETLGGHANRGGMLMNYSNPAAGYALDNIAVIRTVWVRAQGRYPEMTRESRAAANSTMHVELANNLLWDQQFYIESDHHAGNQGEDMGGLFYELNWVGNHSVVRPTYSYGMMWFENPSGRSTVYFADSHLSRYTNRENWQLNYCCNDFPTAPTPARPAWARDARHDFPAVTYLPSGDVRRYALARAGAFPRDPMDRRLMGYIADGVIPGTPPNVNPADDAWKTDYPAASPPRPPTDTDADGMPDAWETERGLDPRTQDHNGTTVGEGIDGLAGYTNLEVYLHQLSEQRLVEGPWGR
jgi:hypothetical protein